MPLKGLEAVGLPRKSGTSAAGGKASGVPGPGKWAVLLLAGLLGAPAYAQMTLLPQITTVAGNGTQASTGDNGLATSAELDIPAGVAFDSSGNYYIAEFIGCKIRKVTIATGDITTVAGNGTCGYSGDTGQATSAEIYYPNRVVLDSSGNIYIADYFNSRIRKVTVSSGVITTVAGNGTAGYSGDGAAATSAEINKAEGVFVDSSGNIYIADGVNNRVREVSASTGYISTVAGGGSSPSTCSGSTDSIGDGCAATSAQLNDPNDLYVDSAGNIYIDDLGDNRIRKVTASTGYISTVAGGGSSPSTCSGSTDSIGDGCAATGAELNQPYGVVVDSAGNIYIGDNLSYRVRMVNAGTGIISTIAGTGVQSYSGDNGPAISAQLGTPNGMALDNSGNLYFADSNNNRIRKVTLNPAFPTTALGSSAAAQNVFLETTSAETLTSFTAAQSQGSKQEYTVGTVTGCTVNGSTSNPSGTVCTVPITFSPAYPGARNVPLNVVAGGGNISFGLTGTGTGPQAALSPGIISTVAGNGTAGYTGNGAAATSGELYGPAGAAVDNAGNFYIADLTNNVIRKVTALTGYISTVAGTGTVCSPTTAACGDGAAAISANLKQPNGVSVDSAGNIYITDSADCRIRKVTVGTSNISTVAGNGNCGYSGDGGLATSAEINFPFGDVAFDSAGNFYIADAGNNAVRKVTISTGIITTVAGNGIYGMTTDGTAATSARLATPAGVAVDSSGNIYFSEENNAKIRKVVAASGLLETVAGIGAWGYWGNGSLAVNANLQDPQGVAVDAAGNVYFADRGNNAIRVVYAGSAIIETIAGDGAETYSYGSGAGYSGDNGPATSASMNYPRDVALDSAGNLFIADFTNNVIRKVTVGSSQLSYATSTAVGTVDTTDDPQTTTVANIGNASLTIAVPSTGTNPSVSSYFALDNSTTCPELTTASSAGTLASGSSCSYAVDFEPTATGSVSGSVVLTDNSLGVTGTTQTISTTATAIAVNTTTTLSSSANPSNYLGSVTFTATVSPVSGSAVPTGPVQFSIDGSNVGSAVTLSGETATYTTSTLTGGTHSIGAVYTSNSSNYNSSAASTLTQTVNKLTPTVSVWPTASGITYGQTLASSTLTGGTASVGGTFAWTTSSTAPGAGTPSESVTFTPSDTTDYNTVAGSVSVTVSKATPTVSVWPTASGITYGQTLASSTLTGGTASVGGTFAWTTPTTAPGAGTPSESVKFTPSDTTDYKTVTGSVSVTVSKATPTVSVWPTASGITYGQTLASSTLTGGTASVGGTFAWTTSSTAPGAGTPSESVMFTPSDTTDYNTVAGSVSVTVSKATPTVSVWPTASGITYGQTLASSTLTGGTASVGGTFAWTTSEHRAGRGDAFGERDVYAFRYDGLQHGCGQCFGDGEQGYADGIGVADGEWDHLRADAGFFDLDGRYGERGRDVCLDDVEHRAGRGDAFGERDVYAFRYDGLQHGCGQCFGDGEQGYADGIGVADGEWDHLRADAGFFDLDGRYGERGRDVCVDDVEHRAGRGDAFGERDVYAFRYDGLQHGCGQCFGDRE